MYLLKKSPKINKKYRIITPDNKKIDFGANGYSNYTIHKNPKRMRLYVQRHGGKISKKLKDEINNKITHKKMLKITHSSKENWSKSGINTAGFWSRWLLWSYPNLDKAIEFIRKQFRIVIVH